MGSPERKAQIAQTVEELREELATREAEGRPTTRVKQRLAKAEAQEAAIEAARAEAEAAITEEVEPAAVAEPRPAPTKALAQIQAELEADIAIAKNRIADIRVELPTQGTVII